MRNSTTEEILAEYVGECRTCKYWTGDRHEQSSFMGKCSESKLSGAEETARCGSCPFWECFVENILEKIAE